MFNTASTYLANVATVHCNTHSSGHVLAFLYEMHGDFTTEVSAIESLPPQEIEVPGDIMFQAQQYQYSSFGATEDGQRVCVGFIDLNGVSMTSYGKPGAYRYAIIVNGSVQHERQLHVNHSDHRKIQKFTAEEPSLLPTNLIHRCGISIPRGSVGVQNIEVVLYRGDRASKGKQASWVEYERWETRLVILSDSQAGATA